MTTITAADLERIFADLDRYAIPPLATGEFTIQQYADARGLSYNQASPIVKRAVAAGTLEPVGYRLAAGRKALAYRAK